MTDHDAVVRELLDRFGQTYVEQAGITLRDKPSPLFQLLVLTLLSSARISADIAADSARELFRAGWRTPRRLRDSTWQQRVDALGRGGYRRYDESTATKLEQAANHVLEHYSGDLRRIPHGAPGDVADLRAAVAEVPRIGPTGSGIFCREVQVVWPGIGPFFDDRALARAADLGLPTDPSALVALVPHRQAARLSVALTRSALEQR